MKYERNSSFGALCCGLAKVDIAHTDGLVQGCSNSNALALDLLPSCDKPSMAISMDWYNIAVTPVR